MFSTELKVKRGHCTLCKRHIEDAGMLYELDIKATDEKWDFDLIRTISDSAACRNCWLIIFKELYKKYAGSKAQLTEFTQRELMIISYLDHIKFISPGDLAIEVYGRCDKTSMVMVRNEIKKLRKKGLDIVTMHGVGYKLKKAIDPNQDKEISLAS